MLRGKHILAAFALLMLSGAAFAAEEEWTTDYKAAVARAKKENKALLLDFTGSDWCGWCVKLKKEVFDTKEFKDWAAKNVITVEIDFPNAKAQTDAVKKQNETLSQKYGIEGYPTIIMLSADEKKIGNNMGYMKGGPAAWTKAADENLKKKK